jgi:hypothetical protein
MSANILTTIQKRNKLNTIITRDDKGNGNANHEYHVIFGDVETGKDGVILQFQNGGRNIEGSIHGLTGEDLLEICRHRLQCFQSSDYACRENAIALTHIEEALLWLNKRVEDRAELGILGTNHK